MAISLGAEVTVCGPFGGEVGAVLGHMLAEENLTVRAVPYNAGNGAYVHDRRSGDRQTLAHMVPPQLTRHELDDLYGTVLLEALESDVLVLTGAQPERALPPRCFARRRPRCVRPRPPPRRPPDPRPPGAAPAPPARARRPLRHGARRGARVGRARPHRCRAGAGAAPELLLPARARRTQRRQAHRRGPVRRAGTGGGGRTSVV